MGFQQKRQLDYVTPGCPDPTGEFVQSVQLRLAMFMELVIEQALLYV